MNGKINSVYGGGIVHTIYIEDLTIQTWFTNRYGIDHSVNGTLIEEL